MLITFEGIEGSGKSTQIRHAAAFLRARGRQCLLTQQPGGTRIGRQIRSILLDRENSCMDSLVELLLYAADRRQHVTEVIRPALSSGLTVISDRFHDSTFAYQGFSRAIEIETVRECNRLAMDGLSPDLTVLLDLDPEIGLGRAWKEVAEGGRPREETRFEEEAMEFHRRVRAGYLRLAELEPKRFAVIDAAATEPKVRSSIENVLADRLD
jgi:dTMP kinase